MRSQTPPQRHLGRKPSVRSSPCLGGTWKRKRNVRPCPSQPGEVTQGSASLRPRPELGGVGMVCEVPSSGSPLEGL